jgi:Uma2 family endonuclease
MTSTSLREICSLEDLIQNPLQGTEWVDGKPVNKHPEIWLDGQLIANNGITLKHSKVQATLASCWRDYKNSHQLGEAVYTEPLCRTSRQGQKPDVAYLTPELYAQFSDAETLPQSFPLSAEVVSPTDFAEAVVAKAYEYLNLAVKKFGYSFLIIVGSLL